MVVTFMGRCICLENVLQPILFKLRHHLWTSLTRDYPRIQVVSVWIGVERSVRNLCLKRRIYGANISPRELKALDEQMHRAMNPLQNQEKIRAGLVILILPSKSFYAMGE